MGPRPQQPPQRERERERELEPQPEPEPEPELEPQPEPTPGPEPVAVGPAGEVGPGPTAAGWGWREVTTLGLLYAGYMANTFGLTSFDTTNVARQVDTSLQLSDAATGTVLSVGSVAYAVGKFTAGPVSDVLGGVTTACGSLSLAAAALVFLSTGRSVATLRVGWALARLAQAAAWPGIMLIAKQTFEGNGLGTAVGLISTSSRAGAIAGSLVLGALLGAGRSWRFVLRVGAAFSIVVAAALGCGPTGAGATAAKSAAAPDEAGAPSRRSHVPFGRFLRVVGRSPRIWLVFGANAFLTPVFRK